MVSSSNPITAIFFGCKSFASLLGQPADNGGVLHQLVLQLIQQAMIEDSSNHVQCACIKWAVRVQGVRLTVDA